MSDYRIDIYNEGNDTSWVFSIYEGTRLAAEGFKLLVEIWRNSKLILGFKCKLIPWVRHE